MNLWSTETAAALTAPQEVRLATRRRDGSLHPPRTLWIVSRGSRVFIRSTNGRGADWFRAATATGSGEIDVQGTAYGVRFCEVGQDDLEAVDAAYAEKYPLYPSIVEHLQTDEPRAATLEVLPA